MKNIRRTIVIFSKFENIKVIDDIRKKHDSLEKYKSVWLNDNIHKKRSGIFFNNIRKL